MDALTGATQRQYQDIFILREVNKAFIGFLQKCNGGSEGVDQEGMAHEEVLEKMIYFVLHSLSYLHK